MLFGKPPFIAKDFHELLSKITNNPLEIPKGEQVSPEVEDALKKMLVVDPSKRISWDDLFEHQGGSLTAVGRLTENRIKANLEDSLKESENVVTGMCRFYSKTNRVVGIG